MTLTFKCPVLFLHATHCLIEAIIVTKVYRNYLMHNRVTTLTCNIAPNFLPWPLSVALTFVWPILFLHAIHWLTNTNISTKLYQHYSMHEQVTARISNIAPNFDVSPIKYKLDLLSTLQHTVLQGQKFKSSMLFENPSVYGSVMH